MSTQPEPELWTNEEIAEFLLNNSLDEVDYRLAIQEILAMGIDPTKLDPGHLFHDHPWQRPELYVSDLAVKQSS